MAAVKPPRKKPQSKSRVRSSWEHGVSGYTNHRCRCDICRAAASGYQAGRRARTRTSAHKGGEENPQPNKANRPNERNSMTQEASVWDNPEIKAGGEFVTLEKVGDSVSGTINAIRTHRFDDGKVVPQILLLTDEGEERTLTAGQVRLKAELAVERPEAGDHLKVTLSEIEKRSGGKTLKHFKVEIVRGTGAPSSSFSVGGVQPASEPPSFAQPSQAPSQAPASVPAQPIDAAAAAAALANLSPEQKAALGL